MKILHTADWHIGKKLHKQDLLEDFNLFRNWLVELIFNEKIDVLLVSGDIFDLSNPSNEAQKAYYKSLVQLKQTGVKIIITGGNHDSPSMLNAPKQLLEELEITVIGGLPSDLKETLIPIKNEANETCLVIAAIPYLRNNEIQSDEVAKNYEERVTNLREGIGNHYKTVAKLAEENYPTIPCIAMGHLFAKGVSTSESERDIQIGNQASVEASQFGDYFAYIALGHIHKPQRVNSTTPTFYSGSPIRLSFSEKEDKKRVLIINTNKSFEPISIEIPCFRKLLQLKGNLSQIKEKLLNLTTESSSYSLKNLIEIEVVEQKHDPQINFQLNELIENFSNPDFLIVKHRIRFEEEIKKMGSLNDNEKQLKEMKVQEVFNKRLEQTELPKEKKQLLFEALEELINEVQ